MSVSLQFKYLMHNETARKAMESYNEILQKALQHYQDLLEDYIKLQEQCGQCKAHSSSQMTIDTACTKTKENEPPEKKKLGEFTVLQKRKIEASEQLNMQCKTDRAKLNGLDCWECREYYKNLSLSKEELQKRKNQCSRHRHKHERPNTPEGFWDPEFPETLSSTYRQNKN
ncbi:DNA endonuclease RBBP8 isoform X4 [Monomorium pharaonis]|uniref:DNA endonuclease RBBP8 isoform X4 n=1 Tax=Monomorium pharaonis TaxID=307658 RepID=UPI00102E2055|nr:DNA endonuclease RBBP8 isoform X4 [Monomorium pharaonis]